MKRAKKIPKPKNPPGLDAFSKKEMARLDDARQDRCDYEERLNAFYSLAIPHRPYIGNTSDFTDRTDEDDQDDIFDSTLQFAVSDFASDQLDKFMPNYNPWVKLKPGIALKNTASENAFKEQSEQWEETLYDLIRQTNWYETNLEVFHDLAGAAAGTIIPLAPRGQDVKIRPVLMGNLLMDEGAFSDLDGRWDEFVIRKRHLKEMFGEEVYKKIPDRTKNKAENSRVSVIQGCRRERIKGGGYQWLWIVAIERKIVSKTLLKPGTPAPMNVARWRHAPPNAWGPGPADMALPIARTLDQLAYLNLKKIAKEIDPPMSFVADGVFNADNGIENGTYQARRMGSEPPTPLFEPSPSQNLFFDRDIMRYEVKRALHQDKPDQAGKTPPTAAQWIDQRTHHEQRQQARHRVYREYVLPSLRRFAYVFAMRGELEPIKIDGQTVQADFVNPLSKASDSAAVSAGMQFAQSAVGIFSETGLASMDAHETMVNWQKKLGDNTVVLKAPEEQDQTVQGILNGGRNIVS